MFDLQYEYQLFRIFPWPFAVVAITQLSRGNQFIRVSLSVACRLAKFSLEVEEQTSNRLLNPSDRMNCRSDTHPELQRNFQYFNYDNSGP